MITEINPQFPYYVCLYLVTILLRFIRTYRVKPDTTEDENSIKKYYANYWFFGFESVNVSAGVFILLSEQASKYVAAWMMLYVGLVLFSAFLEEDHVGLKLKKYGHIGVSFLVVAITVYAFFWVDAEKVKNEMQAAALASQQRTWKVAIPYLDQTLNRNFGIKDLPIQSVFITITTAENRVTAIKAAKEIFFSTNGPSPFMSKVAKSPSTLVILEADVVAEGQ
jgi:hypothetical protein